MMRNIHQATRIRGSGQKFSRLGGMSFGVAAVLAFCKKDRRVMNVF